MTVDCEHTSSESMHEAPSLTESMPTSSLKHHIMPPKQVRSFNGLMQLRTE